MEVLYDVYPISLSVVFGLWFCECVYRLGETIYETQIPQDN